MRGRLGAALGELREHLPTTLFAALGGVGLLAGLTFLADLFGREAWLPQASEDLFHTTHFFHLFLSSMATTAMFWRYERRWLKALLVGILGAVLLCGASDIAFPLLGGGLLGVPMEWHVCLVEHPLLVWPFLGVGAVAGWLLPPVRQSTHFAHGGHVFLSSAASVLYLVSFGAADWLRAAPFVFVLLVAAVLVPCCMSDITFPLLLTGEGAPDPRAGHRAL